LTAPGDPVGGSDRAVFEALRIAAAMCFVGHGAFGVITKPAWLPFFALAGIGPELGYRLMPVVGVVDIALGLSVLVWPVRAALVYMAGWAVWTALLRPLTGQGVAEFMERAGNYGVPLALLAVGAASLLGGRVAALVRPRTLEDSAASRLAWILRATTATLLAGHGLLAVAGKPQLVQPLATIGIGDGGAATLAVVVALGWFEIALAVGVLLVPAWPLAAFVCLWKIATELLFPLTGDSVWEFIERGGSYGAPLALAILTAARSRR
jgi:hypothetical protein